MTLRHGQIGRRPHGPRVIGSGGAPTPPVCASPFNASRATIQGYGFTDRLTLSNADQTFSYTTQGGLGATQVWAAGPATLGTFDASTGTRACEWVLDHEPDLTGGAVGDLVQQALVFYTGAFAEAFKITVSYQPSGKTVGVSIGGASVYSAATTATRFGIETNAIDGTVRIYGTGGAELQLTGNAFTPAVLTPVAQVAEAAGLSVGFAGQTVGSSFVSEATSYVYTYAFDAKDLCGTAVPSADPYWSNTASLVDFTSKSGATTVTDVKNAKVFTLRGTASVAEGQLVISGAGWADTPNSTAFDLGTRPMTLEWLGFEISNVAAGYQAVASDFDGTHTTITLQRNAADLYLTTDPSTTYTFANAAGGGGFVIGMHYHLEFDVNDIGELRLFVQGVAHPTVYTGVNPNILGSLATFALGRLPVETGLDRFLEGKYRAMRLTAGVARHSTGATFTPPANFPHNG